MPDIPHTKTPDPPGSIPTDCDADFAKADCYSDGHIDGYMRGYERGWDDVHDGQPGHRQGEKAPPQNKIPGKCKKADRRGCYAEGYGVGYDKGYAKGTADAPTA